MSGTERIKRYNLSEQCHLMEQFYLLLMYMLLSSQGKEIEVNAHISLKMSASCAEAMSNGKIKGETVDNHLSW